MMCQCDCVLTDGNGAECVLTFLCNYVLTVGDGVDCRLTVC